MSANDLKSIELRIPLGCFVAVTGVSVSGRSTPHSDALPPALRRVQGIAGPGPGRHAALPGAYPLPSPFARDRSGLLSHPLVGDSGAESSGQVWFEWTEATQPAVRGVCKGRAFPATVDVPISTVSTVAAG